MFLFQHPLFMRYRNAILYGGIGVSAVVVDYSLFFIFFNYTGLTSLTANVASVVIAMVYAFSLNAFFNFKTKDYIKTRLVMYMAVSTFGLLLSSLVIEGLRLVGIDPNIGKAISLPPIVVLQYLINRTITFKKMNNAVEAPVDAVPAVETAERKRKRVAIIGGGFTGLTAAYRLAAMGHEVTVFEASDTLGGLVAGFTLDGVPLEKAYHFLYKTDRDIIELANELGVGDTLRFYPSSIALTYKGKLYPFMTPLDLLRFTPLSFFNRIRAGVIAVYLGKETRWKKFAAVSAMEWMLRWGGAQVTKVIWEPVLRGKFFNYYDKIAMSYVWSRVHVRVNSKDRGDVTEKLGYFDGGFARFADRLAERSRELGVTFMLSSRPTAIIQNPGGVIVTLGDKSYSFDACLATTPSYVFKQLIAGNQNLPAAYLTQLSAVEYIGAVLMVFSTNKKYTDYYWHNVNDLDHPFLVLLSLSALVGSEKFGGRNIYYIGAYVPHDHEYFSMSDEEIKRLWIEGTKKIFPDFDEATITDSRIFKFKNAQHIVDPGYEQKIVPYQSPLPDVYLANFSQIFPEDRGTNFAVAEGDKVAKLIDDNLQKK